MGEKTQERIRTRGMLGYFGHSPRIIGGMNPVESLVINGTYNEIEPAIITVSLSCDSDGNVEHKTEFLDTESGNKAARLFSNKVGGFSSVINENNNEFIGLDFVLDPNYSTNRGFLLDSTGLTLDGIDDYDESVDFANLSKALFDSVNENSNLNKIITNLNAANTLALDSLNRLTEENEELLSMLTRNNANSKSNAPIFDSVGQAAFSTSKLPANRILDDINHFKTAHLPKFAEPKTEINSTTSRFFNRLKNGY